MLRSQRALRRKRDHSTWNTGGCEPPRPRRGIYTRWRWKMAASQTTSLVPTAVSVALLERQSVQSHCLGSIFITAPVWMSDPISANRQITCLDPRMLTPRSPCTDWSVSYLPAAALFRNLKANISGPNITLLSYILSLSLSTLRTPPPASPSFSCYHIQESSVNAMRE